MGVEQRKHPRYGVHLAVQYTNAEQFVHDYVENLSLGGVFIAGAHKPAMETETGIYLDVEIRTSYSVTSTGVRRDLSPCARAPRRTARDARGA